MSIVQNRLCENGNMVSEPIVASTEYRLLRVSRDPTKDDAEIG